MKENNGSKLLLILAVAGGAIGIGNFLRFPTLFAQFGGWFLVPYFVSFFLIGLPLMCIEWTLGVMARNTGNNSLSTFLGTIYPKYKWIKYLGILSIGCCLIISAYYIYIESWMLGYSVLSIKGVFQNISSDKLGEFLGNYTSFKAGTTVVSIVCVLVTVFLNFYFVSKGFSKGICVLIKYSMPVLLIMALLMLVKVLFTPNIVEGIKYMFRGTPDCLLHVNIWIAAASQMFFSLSVGFTSTMVYVSLSDSKVDIFKDGFSSAFLNMGIEVLIASFITIPVSFLAFGDKMDEVANSSSIAFGLISMPSIFQNIPGGAFWGFLWFFLLFIAALTSSVSMVQVYVSFLIDKLKISKMKSTIYNLLLFISVSISVILISCAIDEYDFWLNTVLMPIGALILIGIVHILGDKWINIFCGNKNRNLIQLIFIIKYITPAYLIVVLCPFIYNISKIMFKEGFGNWEHNVCRAITCIVLLLYGIILHQKINKEE